MQHGMASFASASMKIKEDMKLLGFWIATNKLVSKSKSKCVYIYSGNSTILALDNRR